MANTRLFHRSFAGGEITPEMFGRIDADRYQTGASRVRNMVCKPQGPVQSRPGMQFIQEVKDSTKRVRMLTFKYSESQAYAVEVGQGYIRIFEDGAVLTNSGYTYGAYKPSLNLSSVLTSPSTITLAATHSFVTGDSVRFTVATAGTNVLPSPLRVGQTYYVRVSNSTTISVADTQAKALSGVSADLVKLVTVGSNLSGCRIHKQYQAGSVVTYTPPAGTLGTYSCNAFLPNKHSEDLPTQTSTQPWYRMPSGGIYEIYCNFQEADLDDLHYVQSNDVMTIVHPSYAPQELRRYGVRNWVLETVRFAPRCAKPEQVTAVPRYGERTNVAWWSSGDPVSYTSTGFLRFIAWNNQTLAAGDVLWTEGTNWGRVDNMRWTIHPDTASGGSSINTNRFAVLQNYNTSELEDYNALCSLSNSGGHILVTTTGNHLLQPGARVGFTLSPSGSLSGTQASAYGLNAYTNNNQSYWVVVISDTTFKLSTSDPTIGAPTYVAFVSTNTFAVKFLVRGGTAQRVLDVASLDNSYRVTAVHADGSESEVSAEVPIRNNILSYGAYNVIHWESITGSTTTDLTINYETPSSYRVYRKDAGIYARISEVPVYDVEQADVTVEYGTYVVINWPNHPLADNDPIMLSEIVFGGNLTYVSQNTVYYVRRIESGTQAGKFYLTLQPDTRDFVLSVTQASVTARLRRKYFVRDDNLNTDAGNAAPVIERAFTGAGTYPSAVSYFEQRRVFAGSNNLPQNVWMTKTSTESDLSYRLPTVSDDRVSFRMAAREGFRIRHVVPMSSLLLLTESGEWRVTSVNTDAITPTSISVRPQSYVGSNNVQPVVVNNVVLFAAEQGGHVRELGFSNEQQSYATGDLSLRAAHLFDDYQIIDISVSKAPMPVVWCVSSNGRLLGLTYVPEERITGWHWHDTDGTFESICVVPEGEEDRVYACVKRNINGTDKRYVERMAPFKVQALADVRYSDSWKAYSGAATTTITGLSHLENETVSVLADGKIHPSRTVASGSITLDYAASNVAVGLPYTAELHTLPAVMQVDGFGTGRTKNVGRTWIRVSESPGFQVGTDQGGLTPSSSAVDGASLASGVIEATLLPAWTQDGQVIIQQQNPVPLTVIGMTFEVSVGA